MTAAATRTLYWTPRILSICMALFLGIFSLDVLGQGYSFRQTIAALLMHGVPTFIVAVALIIAWRREVIGGVLFLGLGIFYIVMAWGQFPWVTYLVVSGPLFLIGVLFLIDSVVRRRPVGVKPLV